MTSPLPILILPTGTPADTVAEVRACGYLPVLTDEPDKVRVLMREESSDRHDMLMSGLHAIDYGVNQKSAFFNELYRRINKKEAKPNAPAQP